MSLTRRQITVRTKRGKTYKRRALVRTGEQVRRFVSKHKGKLAIAAGIAAAGIGAWAIHRQKQSVAQHKANAQAAYAAHAKWAEEVMKRRSAAVSAAKEQVAKARQARQEVHEGVNDLERKINVMLHGRTHIRGSAEARHWQNERNETAQRARHEQQRVSTEANVRSTYHMHESAMRSGHFSNASDPYGTFRTARPRLEAGASAAPQPKPKRTRTRKAK